MRRLIWLIVILCAVWSGWWALAASGIGRGLAYWQDAQRAQGWQADIGAVATSGYPLSLSTRLEDIAITDPHSALGVQARQLDIRAPAYWPGDLTVTLPDTPGTLVTPNENYFLRAPGAQARLWLHPGPALALEHLGASAGAWQLNAPAGNLLSAGTLHLDISQQSDSSNSYAITLNTDALVPGDVWRAALAIPPDWPRAFDSFAVQAQITFDRPLDRSTLENHRPQPRAITLMQADAAWGPLRLSALGDLMIDPAGIPTGDLDLRAENWQQMLDLAERSGALQSAMRPQAETLMTMLANVGGDPDALRLQLRFQNGEMFLGPIRLGPAPRIILR